MFKKLFKKKGASLPASFDNDSDDEQVHLDPVADALLIKDSVDYLILRAAWDEYITIKKQDDDYRYGDIPATPCWKALEKVIAYHGDFSAFSLEEQPLLRALRNGFLMYDDVMHTLIDHHEDEDAVKDLLDHYPDVLDHLPPEYRTNQHLMDVLIEVVRDYQWQLEHYSMRYGVMIDSVLDPEKTHEIVHHAVMLPDAHEESHYNAENYLTDDDLGIAPPKNPLTHSVVSTVLDKLAVMEAEIVNAPSVTFSTHKQHSVLDQDAVEEALLMNDKNNQVTSKRSTVLDAQELNAIETNNP